ncbi:Hypothetical protein CINCED_3A004531 [Cinara cedri]|uniref:Uncharacterized protein n=1 Tax=Cinara cedri TaxID=506608 RepID=A0A5E4MEW4_9HEMI|nr:Hypothetical protein CINCED_3A004531 [Cinara cedri]
MSSEDDEISVKYEKVITKDESGAHASTGTANQTNTGFRITISRKRKREENDEGRPDMESDEIFYIFHNIVNNMERTMEHEVDSDPE